MNRTAAASALTVAVSLFLAHDASADTRSWTAVKKVIGKGDTAVVSIDLSQLRSSAAFQQGLQLLLDGEADAKQAFDSVKSECGYDVTAVVSDMTVVMQGDEHPLIAFGLEGLDEGKAIDCIAAVAGKMANQPGVKLTGKKLGKITEYSVAGEDKKLYAAWLAPDVLAFTEDVNDKKALQTRVSGHGATGDLAKFLKKTTPAAPFWVAVAQKDKEDGRTILGGYGKVDLAGGIFSLAGSVVLSKPAEATGMAAEGNEAIGNAKQQAAKQSPALAKAISTVVIKAAGSEVQITAQVPDKDLPAIIPQLDHVF
ncbi:MAG TPA: hypothetical protein VHE35_05320 [Kofleriaceae bacterium]|nr:hypothetical protein [Kofleriaceae bacterium]